VLTGRRGSCFAQTEGFYFGPAERVLTGTAFGVARWHFMAKTRIPKGDCTMKSFLAATAILLAMGATPAFGQSGGNSGASNTSTSSGGQYTGGGIAGTSNGGGTAGTAGTAANQPQNPDYDSTAAQQNSANKGANSGSTTRNLSQGPNGTPYPPITTNDRGSERRRPTTPP
jgi:hypothetical protein